MLVWHKVSEDVRQSECGKFRITRHSKGYSSWLRHEGKRRTDVKLTKETTMHHAQLDKSTRLQRVATFLKDKKKHSTLEIIKKAKVCAVSSIIAELRCNGLDIHCERKGDRFYYWAV